MLSGEPLDPGPLARQGGVERERCVALQVDAAVRASSASLRARYRDRGLVISGVPCDQFAGQEPGKPEEIAEFCSTSYSVMFPRTEKLKVSGQARHPLYELLTALPDRSGIVGDAQWNFEKFIVSPRGKPSRGSVRRRCPRRPNSMKRSRRTFREARRRSGRRRLPVRSRGRSGIVHPAGSPRPVQGSAEVQVLRAPSPASEAVNPERSRKGRC